MVVCPVVHMKSDGGSWVKNGRGEKYHSGLAFASPLHTPSQSLCEVDKLLEISVSESYKVCRMQPNNSNVGKGVWGVSEAIRQCDKHFI